MPISELSRVSIPSKDYIRAPVRGVRQISSDLHSQQELTLVRLVEGPFSFYSSIVESTHGALATRRVSDVECDDWFEFLFHHEEHEGHEGGFGGYIASCLFEFGDIKVEHESCLNARRSNSIQFHFSAQAALVGRFKQTWTKKTMHLNRASDHLTRKRIEFFSFVLFALFVVIHSFLSNSVISPT